MQANLSSLFYSIACYIVAHVEYIELLYGQLAFKEHDDSYDKDSKETNKVLYMSSPHTHARACIYTQCS